MRKARVLSIAVGLLLTAAVASAADVSGKWVAQMQTRGGQTRDVTFNFTVNGDQLTGTMTTPAATWTSRMGKSAVIRFRFR